MKPVRYIFEAIGVYILYGIFRILPLDTASAFGGWLGRMVGVRMAVSRKTKRRLQAILPGHRDTEYDRIVSRMWENLGRVMGEYPHLKKIGAERTTLQGMEHLQDSVLAQKPAIIFGAHAANWEICAPSLLAQTGNMIHLTYRAPNNPWVDNLLWRARTLNGRIAAYPKSRESGRRIMAALKQNSSIGILIDQKYNEGIAVPFMGIPAMTNPVFAQLATRFKCPVIPARCIRAPGRKVQFILEFLSPLSHTDNDGDALPLENVIENAHLILEKWIKEDPGSWLWLHDRWGSLEQKEQTDIGNEDNV